MHKTLCIGFETLHPDAFAIARHSLQRRMSSEIPVVGIELDAMQRRGLYTRAVERRQMFNRSASTLYDPISERVMGGECDVARFLTPFLAKWRGWALFIDGNSLAFADVTQLFQLLDDRMALMCVQPRGAAMRESWSGVMAFNCEHQANKALTLDLINTAPIRDLQRFSWLPHSLVGALPAEWGWVEDETDPQISPALVHFGDGGPWRPGFDNVAFAKEWRRERALWISGDGAAL